MRRGMGMSDTNCQVCEGFELRTMNDIMIAHLEAILAASNNTDMRDAFYSLFNSAFMLGYKTALIESVERNLETLDYMNDKR